MAQIEQLLTDAVAVGPGPSKPLRPEESNRGVTVAVGGIAGAVTATIVIEVSNDNGLNWATRLTFNIAGTSTLIKAVTDTDVDPNGPFPLIRANVTALTGVGAKVNVAVCAARSGAGVA